MTTEAPRVGGDKSGEANSAAVKPPEVELYPEKALAVEVMTLAVASAAIAAHIEVQKLTGGKAEDEDLAPEEKNRREIIIDTKSTNALEASLNQAPIVTNGIDSEGRKELARGVIVPIAEDRYGQGEEEIDEVNDPTEGTYLATHGKPNAYSIAAVSTHGGIREIGIHPVKGEKFNYVSTLIAPGEFEGVLSMKKSTRKNIEALVHKGAKEITVAVMERDCNAQIISEARQAGANIELIDRGNLIWGIKAMESDPKRPILLLGRGGAPEGMINAIAARAYGATAQLRFLVDKEKIDEDTTPVLGLDTLVPGAQEQSFAVMVAITKNTHYDLPAVKEDEQNPGLYVVNGMIIDQEGYHKFQRELPNVLAA